MKMEMAMTNLATTITGSNAPANTSTIDSSWLAVERLSDVMQRAAAHEEWLEVVELATSRHQSLVAHFERFPIGPDNAEFYRQRLTTMLQNEQSLQSVVREARKVLMRDGLVMTHSHQAVGAYLNNSL